MKPLVSIIMPSYNRADLIGETLDSVIKQTYQQWECIVVDDESTDSTKGVVLSYIEKDSRIQLHTRPANLQKGASACRNYGFELSKGKYVNWFDSDDIMVPEKLEIQLSKFKENKEIDFVICQTQFIDSETNKKEELWNDKLFSDSLLSDFITKNVGWSTNSPLWLKQSLIHNNICFNERLQNGQDYEFHIKILQNNLKPAILDQVLVYNRCHESQIMKDAFKAFSKSIIHRHLSTIDKKILKTDSIDYIYRYGYNVLKRFLLEKKYLQALLFSFKIMNRKGYNTLIILKYLAIGILYKILNKGSKFLVIIK